MKKALKEIQERIRQAAVDAGRDPEAITLVAVSKTQSAETVRQGIEAGIRHLGENYIQEAIKKMDELTASEVTWHFIGHLQSNKAKYAVGRFDWLHGVDSRKLARTLDREAEKQNLIQKVLIEVNIAGEDSKFGVAEDQVADLAKEIGAMAHLSLRGLMTMPPLFNDPEGVRPFFSALRRLRDDIGKLELPGVRMEELSMGMTGDFEAAVAEGATMVRIGTAIFGARS